MSTRPEPLTPELLLQAYARGYFPMSDAADDPGFYWVYPKYRGVIPLDGFRLPRKLARKVRSDAFRVTVDADFPGVMAACAAPTPHPQRRSTWINGPIRQAYTELHELGFAHSVECWNADGVMVGGLYGVHLGAAFFGESMFSRETDASKVALVHLVGRLIAGGFTLLDTQFVTPHLMQFGAVEIKRDAYLERLNDALPRRADFYGLRGDAPAELVLQSITQTS